MFVERLPRGSDGLDYCPSLLLTVSMIFVLAPTISGAAL